MALPSNIWDLQSDPNSATSSDDDLPLVFAADAVLLSTLVSEIAKEGAELDGLFVQNLSPSQILEFLELMVSDRDPAGGAGVMVLGGLDIRYDLSRKPRSAGATGERIISLSIVAAIGLIPIVASGKVLAAAPDSLAMVYADDLLGDDTRDLLETFANDDPEFADRRNAEALIGQTGDTGDKANETEDGDAGDGSDENGTSEDEIPTGSDTGNHDSDAPDETRAGDKLFAFRPRKQIGTADNDALDGTDGRDWIFGGDGNDTINGFAGSDKLFGGGGDDFIDGGDGNDKIWGGTGNDTLLGGDGNDKIRGDDGDDTIDGGSGNDWLSGGRGDDVIAGGSGDDRINGDSGDDSIEGDNGNDFIRGGLGDDSLFGDAGNDRLAGGRGLDLIEGGVGDDFLSGGADSDYLSGGDGNDRLRGGSGDDRLEGGEGDDRMVGGSGADEMEGGVGDDVIVGDFGPPYGYHGTVGQTAGTIGALVFGFGARLALSGGRSGGDDILSGGEGDDWISGGGGDDLIEGGTGNDWMAGGHGADTFVFAAGSGFDTVADFQLMHDRMTLGGFGIGDFTDLSTHISQTGVDTRIELATDDIITLLGIRADDLSGDHFNFT